MCLMSLRPSEENKRREYGSKKRSIRVEAMPHSEGKEGE